MQTIGLLGGMSWESTVLYYQIINRTVQSLKGGLHSAQLLLYSFDFHEIEQLQHQGDWEACALKLSQAAVNLERAGADLLVLCTNTMHLVAPQIEQAIGIPLLHIADPTAAAIRAAGLTRIGLLGTRFTMEQAFYKNRLTEHHGLEVITPPPDERTLIHRIIYDELCQGQVRGESRAHYRQIMANLVMQGAQAIILGCTEITLLVDQSDATVPLFDTTALHASSAARLACGPTPGKQ